MVDDKVKVYFYFKLQSLIKTFQIYHATCHADAVKSGNMTEKDTEMEDVKLDLKRKMDDQPGQAYKLPRTE